MDVGPSHDHSERTGQGREVGMGRIMHSLQGVTKLRSYSLVSEKSLNGLSGFKQGSDMSGLFYILYEP